MFIGHYSLAFAVKGAQDRIPLWVLFGAVQFLDVVGATLVLPGMEKVRRDSGGRRVRALLAANAACDRHRRPGFLHPLCRYRVRASKRAMKAATALGIFFAVISATKAEPDLRHSLGAQLVAAVTDGDTEKTRALLGEWKETGKPWPLGPEDAPLLFLAIDGREKTHPEISEVLLENGATVNARGPLGMTALHWAAANGYVERTEPSFSRCTRDRLAQIGAKVRGHEGTGECERASKRRRRFHWFDPSQGSNARGGQ